MKKHSVAQRAVLTAILLAVISTPAMTQSFGGGISVFVPWDMFEGETGSISFESSLETSLGLGEYVSFPVGISYNQIYGLSPDGTVPDGSEESEEALSTGGPWFYADSLLPYLLAKIHIPAGPMYFDVYGGGALNYNFSLRPFERQIARDLRDAGVFGDNPGTVAITDIDIDSSMGAGWIVGAGTGLQIDQIRVGLDVSYRHVYHDLKVSGEYLEEGASQVQSFDADDTVSQMRVLLRGFSIGIGGSFSM
ncbi:MAG: hypothetical protein ACOCYB_09240 [Alkalispirochaeta sp.]